MASKKKALMVDGMADQLFQVGLDLRAVWAENKPTAPKTTLLALQRIEERIDNSVVRLKLLRDSLTPPERAEKAKPAKK